MGPSMRGRRPGPSHVDPRHVGRLAVVLPKGTDDLAQVVGLLQSRLQEGIPGRIATRHPERLYSPTQGARRHTPRSLFHTSPNPRGVRIKSVPILGVTAGVIEEFTQNFLRVSPPDDVVEPHLLNVQNMDQGVEQRLVTGSPVAGRLLSGEATNAANEAIEDGVIVLHYRKCVAGRQAQGAGHVIHEA